MARGRGATGGECLGCLQLLITLLFILSTLAFSLLARLYLKTYYTASHAAALCVFVGLFLLCHQAGTLRLALGMSFNGYRYWQIFLNTIYFLTTVATAACYTVLLIFSTTFSYDYFGACALTWVNSILTLYLLIAGARKRHDYTVSPNYTGSMFTNELPEMRYLDDSELDREKTRAQTGNCCRRCCVASGRVILWFVYGLSQLLLLIFFILGTYQAACSIRDVHRYRKDSEMYTVKVGFHSKQALLMRCQGNGSETIMFENGLGASMLLSWTFVPAYLADSYRVCAYERRGYGWSESYENDPPGMLLKQGQYARTNVDFFKALMDAANETKPFYFAGYSYGGYHITYMALLYPEYIKGLIFLDSSELSSFDVHENLWLFEILANFIPTGLFRFVLDTGVYRIEKAFTEALDTDEVPEEMLDEFLASVASNLYSIAVWRETVAYDQLADGIRPVIQGSEIYKPVLVIDAGHASDWFPMNSFPLYDPSRDYYVISGASHTTLMYRAQYASQAAERIREWLQDSSGN